VTGSLDLNFDFVLSALNHLTLDIKKLHINVAGRQPKNH
jgi:hypothetical protein